MTFCGSTVKVRLAVRLDDYSRQFQGRGNWIAAIRLRLPRWQGPTRASRSPVEF